MSQIEVDKVIPQSGTALQVGESGDTITIPAGATITNNGTANGFGSADTEKVKVSSNDTTAGFLNGKLVAGTNISLTEGTDGGNETLTAALTGTIATAQIADDAVTLAKMAPGTDGNVISYDASGNPVAVATGSAGQVLTSAGAGAPPTFADAGGGAWNLISTTTISSDATVTVSGMDSTYKHYVMILTQLHPSNNDIHLQGRAIISGSPYTTGNYFSIIEHSRTGNAGCEYDNNEGQTYWNFTHDGNGMGNANSDSMSMIIDIYNPSDTTFEKFVKTQADYNHSIVNNMSSRSYSHNAIHSISSAITGIQFFPSGGNLDTGTIKLYGVS